MPPKKKKKKLTVNDISRPTTKAIAGQDQQEPHCKAETDQPVPELRVGERERWRGNHRAVRCPLIPTKDWCLEHFWLPVQWCTHNRAPYLVLKDPLCRGQARGFKGLICDGQGDEVGDRTKDRVVYFSEEEDGALMICQFGFRLHI